MEVEYSIKNGLIPGDVFEILSRIDELLDNNLSPSVVHFCPDDWKKLVNFFDSDIVYRGVRVLPIEVKDGC